MSLLQFLVFFRLHELAVRIQRVEHSFERAVNQFLVCEVLAIDVILADFFQDVGEQFEAGVGESFSAAWAPANK